MKDRKIILAAVIIIGLAFSAAWITVQFFGGVEAAELSTRDHPDWWRPVGGANDQASTLERRSLMWNDNGVLDGVAPPNSTTETVYHGKFFPRGCRGMIEQIQIYCRRAAAGTMTLMYSAHPCLGPFHYVTVIPGAAWAWVDVDIEEMWDYDSLFIWVHACSADVDWGYDDVQPHDGHWSLDTGETWEDTAIRMFIRVVYTGETPGDVPVTGIINNIPIPSISSDYVKGTAIIDLNVLTTVVYLQGAGYNDLTVLVIEEHASSELTYGIIRCDGETSWEHRFIDLNGFGLVPSTPGMSLTQYAVDARCVVVITHRFEFRRLLEVQFINTVAGGINVEAYVYPTLLR